VRRRLAIVLVTGALLAACVTAEESVAPTDTSPADASPTVDESTAPASSSAAPTPLVAVEAPGQPYDAEDVLALMLESRRPGGVPDQVETPEIAAAVAEQIWTIGGRPWAVASIGGSCGPERCDLEVAGSPGGVAGEDLYLFGVDPSTGSVELLQSVLLGLDPETVSELDRLVRERYEGDLGDYGLSTVRWLPPPDVGRFVLAYRSGGEEGSPALDLVFDAVTGEVSPLPTSWLRSATG
jgi:hypothetical protein